MKRIRERRQTASNTEVSVTDRGWKPIFEQGFDAAVKLWNDGQTIELITHDKRYDASAFGRGMYAAVEAISGAYDSAEREAIAWGFSREEAYALAHSIDTGDRLARESRQVADFNTLPDLLKHAQKEGATHADLTNQDTAFTHGTNIYFPHGDRYSVARVWYENGYFHAQAPNERKIIRQLPRGVTPIAAHAQRRTSEHRAAEPNDAKDVLDGLGRYLEHEGHDAAREASRIARLIRGARNDRKVEEVLEEVNKLIGGHGVEAVRDENAWDNYYGDTVATYVNMGDTYVTTLLYDTRNNEFHITSWGDWYEKYEQERDAEREEEAPESEPYDEDLEETRASVSMKKFEVISADGRVIAHITAPNIEQARRDLTHWYPKGSTVRPSVRSARESAIVRDYIAVDRNDRRVAGPFRSQGEASQHVPPGGHVKFSSSQHRKAPPAPSSYPIFRESANDTLTDIELRALRNVRDHGDFCPPQRTGCERLREAGFPLIERGFVGTHGDGVVTTLFLTDAGRSAVSARSSLNRRGVRRR